MIQVKKVKKGKNKQIMYRVFNRHTHKKEEREKKKEEKNKLIKNEKRRELRIWYPTVKQKSRSSKKQT